MLSSEEAARRLGVKVTTLYAYVSRGLLASHRDPSGRGSLFDLSDIEALANRSRSGRHTESRLATVTTGVTQLRLDAGPQYRGRAATELATVMDFEGVAELLWEAGDEGDWSPPDLGACPVDDTFDRMRWALLLCGATDPLRADRRPVAVTRAARRVIAALVAAVGPGPPAAMTALPIAASVRADPYDALTAGLATLAGPLHGGASQQAYELLARAERDGAGHALNAALREHRVPPGFGHTVYTDGDARFVALLQVVVPMLSDDKRSVLDEVMELAADHSVPLPNCDLALAALAWGAGMAPDSGRTIFAVARVAGWTAHYLEELTERPLRFRARAVYAA